MYLIVAYDVGVGRVNKVKAFLRMNLTWVQNSLFEGECPESRLMKIQNGIKERIIEGEDSVVFYLFPSKHVLRRETMGVEKGSPDENVL